MTAVPRRLPSNTEPHLYMFDAFRLNHPMLKDPTVFCQTTGDLLYTFDSVAGGRGQPNSEGYTTPTYAGLPGSATGPGGTPNAADYQTNAEMTAIACAINMHFRGMIRGSGEYAAGSRSGCLYIKHFGLQEHATDIDPCPHQFHPSDAYSGTAPALIETNCGDSSQSLMVLNNVSWTRFSPYNATGVAKAAQWAGWFIDKLLAECENFTRHSSGPCKLLLPEFFFDDNEGYLRDRHFHFVSSVNDANKASFVDYSPADPTHLLGQSIPGVVYRVNIKNMVRNASDTGDLPRFASEPIWAEYSKGQYIPKTFKDRWNQWIADGLITGSLPLPSTLSTALRYELNAFGQEILWYAIKRSFLDVWEAKAGYKLKALNYQAIKGPNDFSENWTYRYSNFLWDEQVLDCRISQGTAGSFDIAAGLAEAARRLSFCAPDVPIRATFRVKNIGEPTADFGDWAWAKALWKFLTPKGVTRYHWFSYDDQTDALRTAWQDFYKDISDDRTPTGPASFRGKRAGGSGRRR